MPRPAIFISAVSSELKSARQLVANTLHFLGYEGVWQDVFGTEQGDLREMLRRKIDDCAGVIQLVGRRYGFEPSAPDEHFGRVSYTQYEALYAHQRGKKVWYLYLEDGFPADPCEPEPEEKGQLQQAYHARVKAEGRLRQKIASDTALEAVVLKLRDDLSQLRRRGKQWAALVLVLLVLSVIIGFWLMKSSTTASHQLADADARLASVEEKMNALLKQGVEKFPQTEARMRQEQPEQKSLSIEEKTYADLAKQLGVDPKELRERLPEFARQLQHTATASNYERASAAYVANDYAEAGRLALAAADEAQKATPQRLPEAINALELAGQSAVAQIQYPRALEHYREAEALTDKGRDPAEWARLQWDIASALDDNGRYHDAEIIYRGVLGFYERTLGPEHPQTLGVRCNLAVTLEHQARFADAEKEDRTVLAIMERVLGPEDPNTLNIRHNLALALANQGESAEAEREFREVMAIRERVVGPEDPSTVRSRLGVACALDAQGKHAEAENECRAVIAIQERVLGPAHPITLESRYELVKMLRGQGKYSDAEEESRTVIALQGRVLGPEHPSTISSRCALAGILREDRKYAEAESESRSIIVIQERVLGPEHPETLILRNGLVTLIASQGRYAEGAKESLALLPILRRVLGPEHFETFRCSHLAALCLANLGNYEEALGFARDAEQGWVKTLGAADSNARLAGELRQAIEAKLKAK